MFSCKIRRERAALPALAATQVRRDGGEERAQRAPMLLVSIYIIRSGLFLSIYLSIYLSIFVPLIGFMILTSFLSYFKIRFSLCIYWRPTFPVRFRVLLAGSNMGLVMTHFSLYHDSLLYLRNGKV